MWKTQVFVILTNTGHSIELQHRLSKDQNRLCIYVNEYSWSFVRNKKGSSEGERGSNPILARYTVPYKVTGYMYLV